jgi:hypothetical protein
MLAMVRCQLTQTSKILSLIDKKPLLMGGFFAFIHTIQLSVYTFSFW